MVVTWTDTKGKVNTEILKLIDGMMREERQSLITVKIETGGKEVLDTTGTEMLENLIKEGADPGIGMRATVINIDITEEKILQKMIEFIEAIEDQHIMKICPLSKGESKGESKDQGLVNIITQVDKKYETREAAVHLRTVSVLLKEVLNDITERQNHLIRETDTEVGLVKDRDLGQLRGGDQVKNMKGDMKILQEETKGMNQTLKDLALIDRDTVLK